MPQTLQNVPLITTKLHRPPLSNDYVQRPQLIDRLNSGRHRPMTLVCASAGYGKSTIVAGWLETLSCLSGWLSLDETDNDLRLFVAYVLTAIIKLFPSACSGTQSLLNAAELPPAQIVASTLINEIDRLETPFILILDDYHLINNAPIDSFMSELLKHPPSTMHLVIISRNDPSLPLPLLRARDQLNEIRSIDLRFSTSETQQFLQKVLPTPIEPGISAVLEQKTEGWVTGLRLAALSSRSNRDLSRSSVGLRGDNPLVEKYVVDEVISRQPIWVQQCLIASAILNRFCASLCEVVFSEIHDALPLGGGGQEFVAWLEQADLFVIPLDEEHCWFRHHHLFQHILLKRLTVEWGWDAVKRLHAVAGKWFEDNGLIEEAIQHAEKCGGQSQIVLLIKRHRNTLLNHEQWERLSFWLRNLASNLIDKDADLLLLKAWSLDNRLRFEETWRAVDRAEQLMAETPLPDPEFDYLKGGIHALRSRQCYEAANGAATVDHGAQALKHLPPVHLNERGYAIAVMAAGLHLEGKLAQSYQVINDALQDDRIYGTILHTRLLAVLCYLQWMEMDLTAMKMTAAEYLARGDDAGLPESRAGGRYFLGIAHYLCNELDEAESALAPMHQDRFLMASTAGFVQGAFARAAVLQARGEPDEAMAATLAVAEHMLRIGNLPLMSLARAHAADLALSQGRVSEAFAWAQQYEPNPLSPLYRFFAPQMTLAKVLLAEGSAASLRRCTDLLNQMEDYLVRTHNPRFLSETWALQAMLADQENDFSSAADRLHRAVSQTASRGAIRVLIDLGPGCLKLLNRLDLDAGAMRFAGRAIAAMKQTATYRKKQFQSKAYPAGRCPPAQLVDPLSKRENEVLELLAKRLSNKEIAERLFIAPKTVKAHLYNIYQKLEVGSRRKAVEKAIALNLLPDR